MVRNLASEHGVDKKCRTFSALSHVVSLLYAQLTHSIGLNDVCDALRHHSSKLFAIRGTTPPSRNGLSHANKTREADMMEDARSLPWGAVCNEYCARQETADDNQWLSAVKTYEKDVLLAR